MLKQLNKIYEFNKKAGLLKNTDKFDMRENAFIIEEALEGADLTRWPYISITDFDPKQISRDICQQVYRDVELDKVDRLDKALDIIIFAVGSIFKLGLTPEQLTKALDIVCDANLQKLSVGKDEFGKQLKPKDFASPEAKLKKLLEE